MKEHVPVLRCEACQQGKLARLPCNHLTEKANDVLEKIHTDVCGPLQVATYGCNKYFVTFVDDASRKGFVFLLKKKSEHVPQLEDNG